MKTEKFDIYKTLKQKEPLKVAHHGDADGVYSAALINTIFKIEYFYCPSQFGNYKLPTTEGFCDLGLDLGKPLDEEFKGVLIDHHPQPIERKYELLWDMIPTGLIIYRYFRDYIPENELWKVVGSVVGDGQPEKIPIELWDMFPILRERRGTIYRSQYRKITEYMYPVYKLLSGPINAMCRGGNVNDALKIIIRARTPDDILSNPMAKEDQRTMSAEEELIFKSKMKSNVVDNDISVIEIYSKYRMASRIAGSLGRMDQNKTWIVLNGQRKKFSIRGDLGDLVIAKLNDSGITAGGHSGYGGGSLEETQTIKDIVNALRR